LCAGGKPSGGRNRKSEGVLRKRGKREKGLVFCGVGKKPLSPAGKKVGWRGKVLVRKGGGGGEKRRFRRGIDLAARKGGTKKCKRGDVYMGGLPVAN